MPLEEMYKKINEHEEYITKVLSRLIEIPTVVPPGEKYEDCANYLRDLLKEYGWEVQVIKVPIEYAGKYIPKYKDYPRYIVLARLKGEAEKPILHFNGHYDVVPPGTGWTITDPFKPKIIDGKVYGRGATDMKGGIASILLTAKMLAEGRLSYQGTVEISFTPDEEIGGECGVGYIVNEGIVKPDYCIIAEPSGVENIWFGHKGLVWFDIIVKGKAAHGSTPWLGVNAFEKMVEVAQALIKELKPKVESKISKYDYIYPEGKKATMNIGGEVHGGAKVNVVPDYYSFSIDRRVIPEETVGEAEKEVIEFINNLKKKIPGLNVEVKIRTRMKPCLTDPSSKICQVTSKACKEIIGKEPKLTVCIGGLDMRYYAYKGIETIVYGPGVLGIAHMSNEYIEVKDILTVSKVYLKTLHELLK